MTGLDEVRERLEAIKVATEPTTNLSLVAGRRIIHDLAHGALALLESEQEYDPWDHRKRCDVTKDPAGIGMSCQLPKGHTCDHVWFGYAKSGVDGSPERWATLGTKSENGEDGER